MGRTSYSHRLFADGLKKIETRFLNKHGYLRLGRYGGFTRGRIGWTNSWSTQESTIGFYISTFEDTMWMNPVYVQTDEYGTKEKIDYKVPLTTTRCNYGGKRFWFICPLVKNGRFCGRRAGVLYLIGKYFGCRYCYDLTYQSRNENRRSKYGGITFIWKLEEKIEKLDLNIKRATYAGRWTRRRVKLELLRNKLRHIATGGQFA